MMLSYRMRAGVVQKEGKRRHVRKAGRELMLLSGSKSRHLQGGDIPIGG